jgi:hypothetical protein
MGWSECLIIRLEKRYKLKKENLRFRLNVDICTVDHHFFDVFVASGAGGSHARGFTVLGDAAYGKN